MNWRKYRILGVRLASLVGIGAVASTLSVGMVSAQTLTGWVGPTAPAAGIVYLHSSSITDSPALAASSVVYPSFGQMAPAFRMGVQPRLFKSGALCKINNYQYNPTSVARLEAKTSGDCGPGSYNSHGFIQVSDGNDKWTEYPTFPTNPMDYTAPAARSAKTYAAVDVTAGTNAKGQTYGSAANTKPDDSTPDLILAYGSQGETGYVKSSDLKAARNGSFPLFDREGNQIGTFQAGA